MKYCKSLTHLTASFNSSRIFRRMGSYTFVQRINVINNKMEWKVIDEDYDYNQEIATSCYGDMLHDDERNKKFGKALKKAINKLHLAGKEAHVLDIGTGTGLLSMLAAKYGADSIVACEAFLPMANCAVSVIHENNFSDKIKIIKSHSTSLTVGEKGDLKQKANILISEVFDTELIGEGAIKTFNHAFENLLEDDCIVIPSSGTVYAQIVESEQVLKWNKLKDWKFENDCLVRIPEDIKNCPGAAAVHDVQLSEFDQKNFKLLSEVIPIFRFDWAKNKLLPTFRQNISTVKVTSSGKAQAVFMWWDLTMDQEGEIIISCAPVWEHPDVKGKNKCKNIRQLSKTLPWRDHWMQAVYFLTNEIFLQHNDFFYLVSSHDEFSFWFDVEKVCNKNLVTARPVCNCTFHFLLSRTRIGAINDDVRREKYLRSLRKVIKSDTVCVVLNDITLLGVLSAKLGAKKVYVLTESSSVEQVTRKLSNENDVSDIVFNRPNVSDIVQCLNAEIKNKSPDILIISEPYFRHCLLPWDNLTLWYLKDEIMNGIDSSTQITSVRTFPQKCFLKCCAVQFDNLWKIATPLTTCEGFSMKIFDDLIGSAKEKAENYTEAQPLWEYPGIALTVPKVLFEFNLNNRVPENAIKKNGKLEFGCCGRCDGIVFWVEYELSENCVLSLGPVKDVVVNEYISWDMFDKQGVHLFRHQTNVNSGDPIYFETEFDPQSAEFNFNFYFETQK